MLPGSVIQNLDGLKAQKGISQTYGLCPRIGKGFIASGALLSGNEYRTSDYTDTVTVEELKMGVIEDSMLEKQAAFYDVVAAQYNAIVEAAAEAVDLKYFDATFLSPTTTAYYQAGALKITATKATAVAAVTAVDLVDPEFFTRIKPMLMTGFNRAQTPIQPININGKNYWVVLLSPDAISDLECDTTYQNAMKEAQVRGSENPLFTGASAIWNQFVFHSHENVPIGTNSGSIAYTEGAIFGQHALTRAFALELYIREKRVEYEGEQTGIGIFGMGAIKKAVFNSKDYGMVNLALARTALADKAYV
jgi:N4-gp56 family major capsid protein